MQHLLEQPRRPAVAAARLLGRREDLTLVAHGLEALVVEPLDEAGHGERRAQLLGAGRERREVRDRAELRPRALHGLLDRLHAFGDRLADRVEPIADGALEPQRRGAPHVAGVHLRVTTREERADGAVARGALKQEQRGGRAAGGAGD